MLAGDPGDDLGAARESKLGEHGGDVVLHGLLSQAEFVGDVAVGHALCYEVQDLGLARGERSGGIGVGLTAPCQRALVQQEAPGGNCLDHNLPQAKEEAKAFLEIIKDWTKEDLKYPTAEDEN